MARDPAIAALIAVGKPGRAQPLPAQARRPSLAWAQGGRQPMDAPLLLPQCQMLPAHVCRAAARTGGASCSAHLQAGRGAGRRHLACKTLLGIARETGLALGKVTANASPSRPFLSDKPSGASAHRRIRRSRAECGSRGQSRSLWASYSLWPLPQRIAETILMDVQSHQNQSGSAVVTARMRVCPGPTPGGFLLSEGPSFVSLVIR